ncbi:hypothetical protein [Ulvibacterium sp.]|uniref:hypothetical protein n=1 Tax=Ulvibacterium sp. TaxID=2665914 RepID=UPI003BAD6003
MPVHTKKIYGDVTPQSVEDILLAELPSNAWLIDETIKYAKQLNDHISILEDLQNVKELIQELTIIRKRELSNNTGERRLLKRALFTNAIIGYGRCFNYTKKGGRNSIDIKIIKKDFPGQNGIKVNDLIRFHKYIIGLRNSFVAHADKSIYETDRAHIEFQYDGSTLNSIFSHYSIKVYSFDEVQLKNFSILTDLLVVKVEEKKSALVDKLKSEIGDSKLIDIGFKIAKKV